MNRPYERILPAPEPDPDALKIIRLILAESWVKDACIFLLLCVLSYGIGRAVTSIRSFCGHSQSPKISFQAETVQELSLNQFRNWVQAKHGMILDVRTQKDFDLGHVPGALNFPASYFEGSYLSLKQQLERDISQPIALYCADSQCGAAHSVQRELATRGFSRVAIFENGWKAWQTAKLPEAKTHP